MYRLTKPALCAVSAAAELSIGIRLVDHISQPDTPAHGRWLALGIPHRSLGELNEFCDQRATTCRHPCQPHFARRDVGNRRPGDVGALVVGCRRLGKHTETTSRRDMFELLLDAARLGYRRRPLPSAHFFCHRTPFGYGIGVLEQMLTG